MFFSRIAFRLLAGVFLCLFLTQCSGIPGLSGPSRSASLQRLGYESVTLQKIGGDKRFSAIFEVNGSPMRFLIDSGANSTDLDEHLAKGVGLEPDYSVRVVTRGALGREVRSGRGYGTLEVGSMVARRFPFTIAPDLNRKTSTSRYAGQVGLDALSAMGALIDIPASRMWVPGKRSDRAMGRSDGQLGPRAGLGTFALQMGTAGRLPHLILRGSIHGSAVTWVVDTGAEVSVMAAESYDRLGLPSRPTNTRMIDASGDRVSLRNGRLYNVRFGNVHVTEFDVSIAPLRTVRSFFRDSQGRPVDGILGMDFLTQGRALMDSGSGILYMGNP
jgi:predicted aspartyl protease